jgi:phosphatidylglycerophosphate synthase
VVQGLLLVVAVGSVMRASLGLDGASIVRASALFSAIMILVVRSLPAHHPFPRFGAANQVTAIRAALVSLLGSLIGEPHTWAVAWTAVGVATLATSLDGVDGWLARRTGFSSALGARFDLETDALSILVLALLVWRFDRAGVWVLLSGLLRYAFVGAGWAAAWMRRPLRSSKRRQLVCVVQIAALVIALAPPVPPSVASGLTAGALVALGCSFLADTAWLWQQADRTRLAVHL